LIEQQKYNQWLIEDKPGWNRCLPGKGGRRSQRKKQLVSREKIHAQATLMTIFRSAFSPSTQWGGVKMSHYILVLALTGAIASFADSAWAGFCLMVYLLLVGALFTVSRLFTNEGKFYDMLAASNTALLINALILIIAAMIGCSASQDLSLTRFTQLSRLGMTGIAILSTGVFAHCVSERMDMTFSRSVVVVVLGATIALMGTKAMPHLAPQPLFAGAAVASDNERPPSHNAPDSVFNSVSPDAFP